MSTKLPENVPTGHWLRATLKKMDALPFDMDNWSAGAKRTDRKAVDQLMEVLAQILPDDAPPPSVVPTWVGGAQAEWHRNGVDLEISVNPGEAAGFYFSDGNDECEGCVVDDWAKLKEYAKTII